MAFDYKKEYKDLYQPKTMPAIVMVPAMRFVAVTVWATRTKKAAIMPRRCNCFTAFRSPSK